MQGNTKYDLMSECLAMVKQLPRSLDGLQGQDCQPQLLDIIKCSSKFQQLAALPLTDSSLCHRFLCRLRDIVYSLSGRYLSGDGTRHPRALFAGINRKIMESKGGAGYELALLSVAGVINDWVLGVGRDRGLNLGDLQTAISEGQPQIVAMSESCPREKREEGRLRLESLDKLEQAKNDKKKSEQSFMKMVKLDIIADIDIGFLDQRNKQVKEEQIYKQCLQRNKYISILMKKYEEAYRGYESKPASRKNRDYADFKPTTQSKTISLVVRKRPGFHLNSPDCRANYKKMRSLHETLTGTLILDKELNPQQTKQQLLTQLYAYRKKYTMRKVMIGASDLDIKPATMNQTSRARELHKSRPKSQRPASSYKSQRIKATNNYSYIEGIVPVH